MGGVVSGTMMKRVEEVAPGDIFGACPAVPCHRRGH